MKVKELIEELTAHVPMDADIWVEKKGELRRLEHGDVEVCVGGGEIYDNENGEVLETEETFVIFTSWS